MIPQDYFALATPDMARHILFAGKIAGAVGAIGALGYAVVSFTWRVFHKITNINDNVNLMMTNHLPHMEDTLSAHGAALEGIKSDVRNVDTRVDGVCQRLEDTRTSVHNLGVVFTDHIESSTKDLIEAKAEAAKNELDIAAIKAAQKVLDDASQATKNLMDTTKKSRKK